MELIPAIDLLGGRVVRLAEGDFSRVTAYDEEPLAVARRWVGEGATRLHIVDLDGARAGKPLQVEAIARILTAGVPCQVSGGYRSEAAVAGALESGADRVCLGSALIRDPALGGRLVARHGPERIVASIDVREGRAMGDGWVSGAAGTDALELAARLGDAGVTWLAVTAIARDGLLAGPDLDLLDAVARAAPGASLIASAGVATLDDVSMLAERGMAAAILGRALYEGALSLPDALAVAAVAVERRP